MTEVLYRHSLTWERCQGCETTGARVPALTRFLRIDWIARLYSAMSLGFSTGLDVDMIALCTIAARSCVHPVFQRWNFKDISDHEILIIGPAIVLASNIITSPLALQFWHAFLFGRREMVADDAGQLFCSFHRVRAGELGDAEKSSIFQALEGLSRVVSIRFADMPYDGATCPMYTTAAGAAGEINLNKAFLHDAIPSPQRSFTTHLQNYFRLAMTMVHELAHALSIASLGDGREMFFEEQNICEMGHALEAWLVGGTISEDQAGRLVVNVLPTQQWFDTHPFGVPLRAKPLQSSIFWYVSGEFVQALFTNDYWNVAIPRTAGRALRPGRENTFVVSANEMTAWPAEWIDETRVVVRNPM